MGDLLRVDAWFHNVFSKEISLDICEKHFMEFSLEGNEFILNEIKNHILPLAEKRGDAEAAVKYKQVIECLEKCITKKMEESPCQK